MYRVLCLNWLRRLLTLLRVKMSEPLELNAGILIIGSLMWDAGRQAWRNARLEMSSGRNRNSTYSLRTAVR
jgi:hypothetical protein